MDLRELCSNIVIAVLMMGVGGDDMMMSRVGAVLAVCMLTGSGKHTGNVATLFFMYLMHGAGHFDNFSFGGFMNSMQTDNLFLGGMCQLYIFLSNHRDEIPNPTLPF
jgi:hypothetical protein